MNKIERKYGRYAIRNLTAYILAGYAIGYLIELLVPTLSQYLIMNPHLVMKGQIWRLFTWVLTPPEDFTLFTIFMFLFFYWIGSSLEHIWGSFWYNVYIFSGIIFMTAGAMITYMILHFVNPELAGFVPINISTYYINVTSFLAFAVCFPDMQVLFMFFIPLKVKWLAIVDLVWIAVDFISIGNSVDQIIKAVSSNSAIFSNEVLNELNTFRNMWVWSNRALLLVPLINFFIFFLSTRNLKRLSPNEIKRKNSYKRQVNNATKMISKHKCAICGRTEKDGEDLVFRFCSKCNGNYEYCQDHLFNHVHKE